MTTNDKFQCHERRHMTASEFVTYDTMRAMAKKNKASSPNDLVFYGRLTTLANYTNRSVETERINIKSLVKKRWLIPEDYTRWRGGLWGTNRYGVVEHEQYVHAYQYANKPCPCPPFRYDPETGKKTTKGNAPKFNLAEFMERKRRRPDTLTVAEQSEPHQDLLGPTAPRLLGTDGTKTSDISAPRPLGTSLFIARKK